MRITITHDLTAGVYDADVDVLTFDANGDGILIDIAPIPVEPPPATVSAAFTATVDGMTVSVADHSTGAVSERWDWGDSTFSTTSGDQSHTYSTSGTFTITLTADGESDGTTAPQSVATQTVTVSGSVTPPPPPPPPPSTGVGIAHEALGLGMAVAYIDHTTPPDGLTIQSIAWDFGDGETATDTNGQHLYAAPGNYNVTETVTYSDGTTAAQATPVVIGLAPKILADWQSVLYHMDVSQFVEDVNWNFGDGENGHGADGRHTYAAEGTYTITGSVTYKGDLTRIDAFGPLTTTAVNQPPQPTLEPIPPLPPDWGPPGWPNYPDDPAPTDPPADPPPSSTSS